MANLQTHTPASLRAGTPSKRSNVSNVNAMTEAARPYLIAGRKGRTAAVNKTAFMALPMESEDARITGSTRSLDRRLLGLNLKGVQSVKAPLSNVTDIRIA
jgi:hypothetical protein